MNLPNLLTLSRIPLMLAVIGLLYTLPHETWPWIRTSALLLFLFAALTDWLDGWLARKFGQVSEFGKFMDALSDKVLTLGMFVSLLALGELGKWALFPVLLILSREFLITGLRLVAAGKGKTLAAEKVGKLKTIVQLTCISLYLGKIALKVDFIQVFAGEEELHGQLIELLKTSGDLTLLAATVITVLSGIVYLSKYWKFFLDEDA
ncbi:MAG: CDP-diacylglycerol--glycerol-3-phosphate 3-phosphatidyltransferase [Opitutae bacterium]|nr:CDP-diacylglycerol--glycerol-3-phosphate 3-phosphatidyltransferase [Opitutae bacterium]